MKFLKIFIFLAVFFMAPPAGAESVLGPHVPDNARDLRRVEDMISLAEDIEAFRRKTGHYPLAMEPQAEMTVVGITDFAPTDPEVEYTRLSLLQSELRRELGENIELPRDPDEGKEGVKLRIYQYATDGQDYYVSAFLENETFYTRAIADGQFMLELTSRPNVRDSQYGPRLLKRFLKSGADDAQKQEELEKALRGRDFAAAKKAIDSGANVNPVCDFFTTCQHLAAAARDGLADIMKFLIENGADVNGFNASYNVPLMYAIEQDEQEAAEILLEAGADVNIPNALGVTPFISAIAADKGDIVRLMLKKGARVNTRFLALHSESKPGETGPRPLEAAIKAGSASIAGMLLKAGADPALGGQSGKSLKEIAEETGDKKIITMISAPPRK